MTQVFISYRRSDTSGYAGRLHELLSQEIGPDRLFMDLHSIHAGENFVNVLRDAMSACDVVIALIGPHWLTVGQESGRRRLDDPADYVRLEIATALERNVRLIPVLVHGASMPRKQDLPDDLALLGEIQALEITDSRWDYDTGRLVGTILGGADLLLPVINRLATALIGPSEQDQMAAAKSLAQIEHPAAREALAKALGYPLPGLRQLVAVQLAQFGDPRAVPELVGMIASEDSDSRNKAVVALGRIGHASAAPKLLTYLRDERWQVRDAARRALQATGPAAIPVLVAALHGNDNTLAGEVAEILGRIGDPIALPDLRTVFRDPATDPLVKGHVMVALGMLRDATLVPELIEVLNGKRETWNEWQDAIGALWLIDTPEARRAVSEAEGQQMSRIKDDSVRERAEGWFLHYGLSRLDDLLPAIQNRPIINCG